MARHLLDRDCAKDETETPAAPPGPRPFWAMSLGGWRKVIVRAFKQINDDRLGLAAAGIAFYALLSVFPGIAAAVSLYGLLADPADIADEIAALQRIAPGDVVAVLRKQALDVAAAEERAIGLAFAFSLAIAVFSAARGAKAIMHALNVVYDEREKRGLIVFNLHAYAITFALIIGFLAAFAAVAFVPLALNAIGLGAALEPFLGIARWPLFFGGAWAGISVLYAIAPSRSAKGRAVSPGAGAAVVLWVVASLLFSLYVQNFANYNETYGSLGAVVSLLMWFWVSAFVFLVGAEIDSEWEALREDRE